MSELLVAVSPGELLDRLSILEIRCDRATAPEERRRLAQQRDLLRELADSSAIITHCAREFAELRRINGELWSLEDLIRSHARAREPDARIADTALAICRLNDARASAKQRVNAILELPDTDAKIYR